MRRYVLYFKEDVMKNVYAVMWDNGESYEDHCEWVWCVCPTLEKATEIKDQLTKKLEEDLKKISELESKDPFTNIEYEAVEAIRDFYSRIYYFHLYDITFYVATFDYVE